MSKTISGRFLELLKKTQKVSWSKYWKMFLKDPTWNVLRGLRETAGRMPGDTSAGALRRCSDRGSDIAQ